MPMKKIISILILVFIGNIAYSQNIHFDCTHKQSEWNEWEKVTPTVSIDIFTNAKRIVVQEQVNSFLTIYYDKTETIPNGVIYSFENKAMVVIGQEGIVTVYISNFICQRKDNNQ